MKISRILLGVMVLSSILAFSHFAGEQVSIEGFKIAADRVGA
ncbi:MULTISPECIES: hypothetical protein [Bacillus amyloliquefaciens group]|nr:hypothetical protein [Bacillus amyloliquefaciens]AEB22658.1 hypothetical protein BAMTA208_02355 [Bacillus amyloliquefaciens TA208]MEC1833878.1 hypothetical protein [Bacillus amyloliquefaciens]MEC1838042.1 hypothetical protein [Bacillus amyloliquefaciens]MEC1844839.1 hypothetical protein [Bacillus amyloliquefaciens]MEC1872976.1 hypothetical protein [Bacillus amyloliquefaciens]